jgi:hypothetical protein
MGMIEKRRRQGFQSSVKGYKICRERMKETFAI